MAAARSGAHHTRALRLGVYRRVDRCEEAADALRVGMRFGRDCVRACRCRWHTGAGLLRTRALQSVVNVNGFRTTDRARDLHAVCPTSALLHTEPAHLDESGKCGERSIQIEFGRASDAKHTCGTDVQEKNVNKKESESRKERREERRGERGERWNSRERKSQREEGKRGERASEGEEREGEKGDRVKRRWRERERRKGGKAREEQAFAHSQKDSTLSQRWADGVDGENQ
eukprot:6190261-Pleurochrysis_carterae.AAC.2